MINAFLAALLKVAAEERLKAESERNLQYPEPCTIWEEGYNQFGEDRIKEHEGLAEIYESFAHRLIADVASDLILAEFQKLDGEAALLSPSTEIPFEFRMGSDVSAQLRYHQLFGPPVFPPQSLVKFTGLIN